MNLGKGHLVVGGIVAAAIFGTGFLIFHHFSEGDARMASRVPEAQDDAAVGDIGGKDEIAVLGRSFDHMADRIRSLIRDIRDKADLEKRLSEQQLAR